MTHPTVPPPTPPAQPHVDEADRALANILRPWVTTPDTGRNRMAAPERPHHMTTRYATRRELVGLLAEDDLDLPDVRAMVDRLTDLGVDVEQLVTITSVTTLGQETST